MSEGSPLLRRARNGLRKSVTALLDLEIQSRTYERGTVIERGVRGLEGVDYEGRNLIARGTEFHGHVRVGLCTTIHAGCDLTGPLKIGAYCQLAPHCAVYPADHPLGYASMYANERALDGATHGLGRAEPVEIADGAWLGHGVAVLKGVTIGRGAAVGAGSVVTKSVPPYSVAAGNPAKVVQSRFPESAIELVESTRWWELTPEQLNEFRAFFMVDLATADEAEIDRLRRMAVDIAGLVRIPRARI